MADPYAGVANGYRDMPWIGTGKGRKVSGSSGIAEVGDSRWRWLRWLVPSSVPLTEQRTSILSVRVGDARTFFALAATFWLVAAARIDYKSLHAPMVDWPFDGTPASAARWGEIADVALAATAEFSGVVVGIAVVALLLTRPVNLMGGILMTIYQAMVNRFVIPVIEAHKAEGFSQGREAGLQEGREAERSAWLAWNARRTEAARRGMDFTESPPD